MPPTPPAEQTGALPYHCVCALRGCLCLDLGGRSIHCGLAALLIALSLDLGGGRVHLSLAALLIVLGLDLGGGGVHLGVAATLNSRQRSQPAHRQYVS